MEFLCQSKLHSFLFSVLRWYFPAMSCMVSFCKPDWGRVEMKKWQTLKKEQIHKRKSMVHLMEGSTTQPLNSVCLLCAIHGGGGRVSAAEQFQVAAFVPAGLHTHTHTHSSASHRHLYLNQRKTLLFLSVSTGEGFFFIIPIKLRFGDSWHDSAHINNTYSLRTSSAPTISPKTTSEQKLQSFSILTTRCF